MNNIISWNNQLQSSGFNFSCQQFCRDKIRNISHNNYVPSFAVWLLSVQYNISFLLSSLSFSSLSWSYFSETRCYFSEILLEPRTHKNIMRERKNWWNPPPQKKQKNRACMNGQGGQQFSYDSEALYYTCYGLGRIFGANSADMCGDTFPLM